MIHFPNKEYKLEFGSDQERTDFQEKLVDLCQTTKRMNEPIVSAPTNVTAAAPLPGSRPAHARTRAITHRARFAQASVRDGARVWWQTEEMFNPDAEDLEGARLNYTFAFKYSKVQRAPLQRGQESAAQPQRSAWSAHTHSACSE